MASAKRATHVGRVVGLQYGPDVGSEPTGVLIEIGLDRNGFLPAAAFGRFRAQRMASVTPGEEIMIEVMSSNAGIASLALATPIARVGQRVVGYVAGFLPGTYGHARAGVFVELFPNCADSLVHHTHLPAHILKMLEVGDQVSVRVMVVDVGARGIRYKLRLL